LIKSKLLHLQSLQNNDQNCKKLEIFSKDANGNRVSDKVSINNLNEIYQYADKFKAIVAAYEHAQAVAT
jgi:predicted type IV restriction endonuclease